MMTDSLTVRLPGEQIENRAQLHQWLAHALTLPDWYGNTLDALYDCLTDLQTDTILEISQQEALADTLGTYMQPFLQVLADAAEENLHLTVRLV